MMVGAQAALPAWVRARGMAFFTLVLTGSIALGSALAGLIAAHDLRTAHLAAAVTVVVGMVVARRWPMTAPREIDLTVIPGDEPIPDIKRRLDSAELQEMELGFLQAYNRRHLKTRGDFQHRIEVGIRQAVGNHSDFDGNSFRPV